MANYLAWTTVPSGLRRAADGNLILRIGLVASIKLGIDRTDQSLLSDAGYHDFVKWTNTLNTAAFTLKLADNAGTESLFAPDLDLLPTPGMEPDTKFWETVFPANTVVRPFGPSAPQDSNVKSYDARSLANILSLGYFAELGPVKRAFSLESTDLRANPMIQALMGVEPDASILAYSTANAAQIVETFKEFSAFHTVNQTMAPAAALAVQPEMEFHEIASALQDHNGLAQKLGLVLNFDVPIPESVVSGLGEIARIKVDVRLSLNDTIVAVPWTWCDVQKQIGKTDFGVFHPRRSDGTKLPDWAGFRSLEISTGRLTNLEIDWLALQLAESARQTVAASVPPPDYHSVPAFPKALAALRQSGISLIDLPNENPVSGQPLPLIGDIKSSNTRLLALDTQQKSQVDAQQPDPNQVIFVDDGLIRGYRVYIRSVSEGVWRSLCSRTLSYTFHGGPLASPITWAPGPDEGEITKVLADQGGQSTSSPFLFNWDGWSLVAPRSDNPVDEDGKAQEMVDEAFKNFAVKCEVVDETLQTKRYGETYEFCVVPVDLAGNAWSLKEASLIIADATLDVRTAMIANQRLQPIRSPSVFESLREQGEKGTTVAIRAMDGRPTADSVVQIVPSDADLWLVDEHGSFDAMNDEESYDVIVETNGDLVDLANAGAQAGAINVPFLPDPMCRGVVIRSSSGELDSGPVAFPSRPDVDEVKKRLLLRSVNLSVRPGAPDSKPSITSAAGSIVVSVPLGETVRALMSSALGDDDYRNLWVSSSLETLLSFQKPGQISTLTASLISGLSASMKDEVVAGSEYLVTPPREVTFVHATQRPTKDPSFGKRVRAEKTGLKSFAVKLIDETFSVHIPSTGRVEFAASWTDVIDEPWSQAYREVPAALPPFGFDLTEFDQSLLGVAGHPASFWQDSASNGGAVAMEREAQTANRQEPTVHAFPDTKYRTVTYRARATSRFRSFMPEEILKDPDALSRFGSTTVEVLNSAPPDAPEIRAILPIFKKETTEEGRSEIHVTGHRFLFERPWLSSGPGEMAIFSVRETELEQTPAELKSAISSWAFNPRKRGAPTSSWPTLDDFVNAGEKLIHIPVYPEGTAAHSSPQPIGHVSLAAYDVEIDAERNVVWCDVQVDPGRAYFPFLRYAVGRYQPKSIDGAALSKIVTSDFVQISPTRTVSLGSIKDGKRAVTVAGFSYVEEGASAVTSVIEVFSETPATTAAAREAVLWNAVGETIELTAKREGAEFMTWSGEIPDQDGKWRLTIVEYEIYLLEESTEVRPDEGFKHNGLPATRRMTFIHSVELKG
ncbi:hypothetical protein [Rhizobium sp. Root483D2]|uniref:hypothetical protein n=1 Tax=Rhizobium sp. Root483D2 TaxID=1736545 RepID=UPI0007160B7D|nr:hypothetical protein [Rhizobium sp. Root483D2]KQY25956.1 hypothetical protein ASD32_26105 [Rhizobium sp. Root483D2]